tara:strand:- start:257 stop:502 length:246 start_codon:yes stop_codon:yes gene_type:complete
MKENIKNNLFKVFKTVFETSIDSLNMNINQNSFENWDSLNHILLIVEIENEFNIKFNSGELSELTSMNKLYETILKHLKNN